MVGKYPMQNLCLAVIVMMPLLSSIFCALRFHAKRRSASGVGVDDWLIVIAVIFSIVIIYPSWRLTVMWHYGVHIWDVDWHYYEPPMGDYYRMTMVFFMFSVWILPLVKASIMILLLKLGGIITPVRIAVYTLFAVNLIGAVVPALFYLFECPPLTGNTWQLRTFGNLHCAGRIVVGRINIFQVCINMFTDLLIFPIPVYLTWRLQKASLRDRLVVLFLFSLSLGVTAIGAPQAMAPRPLVVAALSAGLLAPLASAMYSSNSPVIQLTSKNFNEKILKSDHASIVEFYAPWCGHCKNLKPAYEAAAGNLKGLAQVAAIDCDEDANKATCAEYGIQGFPTIKSFKPKKNGKPTIQDYQGPRNAKGIVDYALDLIPNYVTRVNSKTLEDFLQKNNETAKAILFTKKGVATPLYKALAIDFHGAITFAQVRDKETDATELFGIEKFPTLVVLPGGSAEGVVYDGDMKKDPMFAFFTKFAEPTTGKKPAKEDKAGSSSSTSSTSSTPPRPTFDATIPDVPSMQAFAEACGKKVCVLVIVPFVAPTLIAYEKTNAYVNQVKQSFPFFQVPLSTLPASFKKALELEDSEEVQMRAVSAKRRWWVPYTGDSTSYEAMESWIDALKMGELNKKKLPDYDPDNEEAAPEAPKAETPKEETSKEEEPVKEVPKHEEL
ncbi:hypothetical protein Dda_1936 [Drechslerella dactyloides]|uniref:protein disulfide-isomerase n=1 Tax=Drechslerella dactyloides TaxID=74499 RepID=A0AAD6J2T5_DREDA|nr:hypothetical protein Dda_1936 [Drechslerella dactyloides]